MILCSKANVETMLIAIQLLFYVAEQFNVVFRKCTSPYYETGFQNVVPSKFLAFWVECIRRQPIDLRSIYKRWDIHHISDS